MVSAMNAVIPVSLSLKETSAVALVEAAVCLNGASNIDDFISALDKNHRLWRTLIEFSRRNGWDHIDRRTGEFVMATLHKCGCGVIDSDIEALVSINNGISQRLADGREVERIRRRAQLAWRDSGVSEAIPLEAWLIDRIEAKAQL